MLVAVALLTGGCASTNRIIDDLRHTIRFETDHETLDNGFAALQQRHYAQAEAIFADLKDTTGSKTVQRKARYGYAFTRLMRARTPGQQAAAIALWDAWRETYSPDPEWEDPRVLEPLFLCRAKGGQRTICKGTVPEGDYKASLQKSRRLQLEVDALSRRLQALEISKTELLDAKNQEIRNLKEKIRALEAIDQKIQKKKKEISAPQ
ncbi:MAG: hypothetical protein QNJ22_07425 [Desulfosarcinaceae bacterium]|nr:hypothetical protein [Desulfosarcinaceae bacterium]